MNQNKIMAWILIVIGTIILFLSLLPMVPGQGIGSLNYIVLAIGLVLFLAGGELLTGITISAIAKAVKVVRPLIPFIKKPVEPEYYVEEKIEETEDGQVETIPEPAPTDPKDRGNVIGQDKKPTDAGTAWKTFRDVKHQVFDYSVPTYILDENAYFVDWNFAFDFIFSDIVGDIEAKHVTKFINRLMNTDEVMDHAREFTQKNPMPLVDTEVLRFYNHKYGQMEFLKIASQLHDEKGKPVGWAVVMNILRIRKETEFRDDWQICLDEQKNWSVYAPYYDPILKKYPEYNELLDSVIGEIGKEARLVADLGAGTGNVTEKLLNNGYDEVWAIENNPVMLDLFRAKPFADDSKIKIIKASVQNLAFLDNSIPSNKFDAVVAVNVLYSLNDPLLCLRGVNRILKRDGIFVFSTTHENSNLASLMDNIHISLDEKGVLDKRIEFAFKQVKKANSRLVDSGKVTNKSIEEYEDWINRAGFSLVKRPVRTYQDVLNIFVIKKDKEFEELHSYTSDGKPTPEPPEEVSLEEKILVIEDDPYVREQVVSQLESFGYEVIVEADNRLSALKRLQEEDFDLIISDKGLPDQKEGMKLFEEIRNNKKYKKIPFILLSAFDKPEERKEVKGAGITNFLNKPWQAEDLKKMVQKALIV